MTELLFGARDELPAICGICSRVASPVGVTHPPGQHVLWLCELCTVKPALKVADMNPIKLTETEAQAIDAAAAKTVDDVISAAFGTLWGEGIRDLEALNGDNFPVVTAKIAASPEYRAALRDTLVAYTVAIRTAVANAKE
jgi:hypothetical protein